VMFNPESTRFAVPLIPLINNLFSNNNFLLNVTRATED